MVHHVRRASGFPPPEGYAQWSDDAAYDVKYFLIDEARQTPRGKLRRRIARLMSEDTSFRRRPGSPLRWALSGLPEDAVGQGDLGDLIAEASRVDGVGITRWNRSGTRKTVHARMTVLTRVLQHAQGAVREEDLAKVLESRFELLAPARFTTLFAADGTLADPAETGTAAPPDPTDASGDAEDIWQRLTADERLLLPRSVDFGFLARSAQRRHGPGGPCAMMLAVSVLGALRLRPWDRFSRQAPRSSSSPPVGSGAAQEEEL